MYPTRCYTSYMYSDTLLKRSKIHHTIHVQCTECPYAVSTGRMQCTECPYAVCTGCMQLTTCSCPLQCVLVACNVLTLLTVSSALAIQCAMYTKGMPCTGSMQVYTPVEVMVSFDALCLCNVIPVWSEKLQMLLMSKWSKNM